MNLDQQNRRCNAQRQKNQRCFYFDKGYCRFGDRCRYRHDGNPKVAGKSNSRNSDVKPSNDLSKGKTCGICFEEIVSKKKGSNNFGILPNCKHCFCFPCIKLWRSSIHFDEEVTKSCPECRINSIYVYKSSFWVDSEDKEKFITARNKKLANIDCKYFRSGKGVCRLAERCLFRHKRKHSCQGHTSGIDFDDNSSMISFGLSWDGFSDDLGFQFEDAIDDSDFDPLDFIHPYQYEIEFDALTLLDELW